MDAYLQIADEINKSISTILRNALSNENNQYKTKEGYVRWGLVETDIHKAVTYHLTRDEK